MDLLFERFLSEERGEWPDIDLDLPSGDPREKVIQHVYRTYGPAGAAMTANVITYRDRSASREMAKALGFSPEQVDTIAKRLGKWSFDEYRDGAADLSAELAAAGFDPAHPRVAHFGKLFMRVQNLPRHLGQHSGGMVVAMGKLSEVVPLEPAAMEGRVVIQWGQGRLRGPRHREGGPPRPRNAGRDREDAARDQEARGRGRGSRASPGGRPEGVRDAERGGHDRPLPGGEPRADGFAAAPRAEDLLRHRRAGRDHPAGADRGRDGASPLRPAAGHGAGRVPAPVPRADPEAHARRAAFPGAASQDRDGGCGLHGRRGGRTAPRDGLQALAGAHGCD